MVPRRTRRTGSRELTSADSIALPARASAQRQRESRCPRPYSPAGGGRASSAARSSRSRRTSVSMARTSKRFTNTSTRNAPIRDRRAHARRRAAGHLDAERLARRLREEREELPVGLVAGIAAAGGEHACFLGAGVAEEPQLRGQHDHPRIPDAAVVPLEVQDGARAERGWVEARAVVAERPLDDVVEPDRLARDADGEELLARPELFRCELEPPRARGAASAVQSARSRQAQKEVLRQLACLRRGRS